MTYALRLPTNLDASARAHAKYLGISFNAFLCIAVEGHLRDYPPSRPELRGVDVAAPRAKVPPGASGGKVKKEKYSDRQRARDTAFKPVKPAK